MGNGQIVVPIFREFPTCPFIVLKTLQISNNRWFFNFWSLRIALPIAIGTHLPIAVLHPYFPLSILHFLPLHLHHALYMMRMREHVDRLHFGDFVFFSQCIQVAGLGGGIAADINNGGGFYF